MDIRSRIEHNGAPIGVEVHFAGGERHGLPLAVPGRNARRLARLRLARLELENRSTERLKLGLILRNEPGSWQEGQAAGLTLHSKPLAASRGACRCGIYSTPRAAAFGARRRCRFLPPGARGFGVHPRSASDAVERSHQGCVGLYRAGFVVARSIGAAGWTATASARTGRGRAK